MKDFSEFMSSLTREKVEWICNGEEPEKISINVSNLADAIPELTSSIISHDFQMNLRFLQVYHEWLCKQIQ